MAKNPRKTTKDPETDNIGPSDFFIRMIQKILSPLVRVLVVHGISFPMVSEILKRLYVAEAEKYLQKDNAKKPTDSSITLCTRVHRKDVKRLRGAAEDEALPKQSATLGAQIIGYWLGAEKYCNDAGEPLNLPKTSKEGAVSFEMLVSDMSKDVRPRAVLDELLRLDVVLLKDNMVCLNKIAFIPEKDFEDLLYYYGRNLHDHIAVSSHNILGQKPPMLERSVAYTGLSESSVAELEEYARGAAMGILIDLNKKALALSKKDEKIKDTKHRMNFGVYYLRGMHD